MDLAEKALCQTASYRCQSHKEETNMAVDHIEHFLSITGLCSIRILCLYIVRLNAE
jgi:hypothetical protein